MSVFHMNCSLPNEGGGIVASPEVRGTLDILWGCLAVIFLCTWVGLHENIVAEGAEDAEGCEWLKLKVWSFAQKTCAFTFALFAPELFTGKALMGLYFARLVRKTMNDKKIDKEVKWTLSRAFFANMGGFAIEFDKDGGGIQGTESVPGSKPSSPEKGARGDAERGQSSYSGPIFQRAESPDGPSSPRSEEQGDQNSANRARVDCPQTKDLREFMRQQREEHPGNMWFFFSIPTVVHGRWHEDYTNNCRVEKALETVSANDLGYQSSVSFFQNLMALRGNIWAVDGIQLEYALSRGIISHITPVTDSEIQDRSKGDIATKLLAILQVGWLLLQLIARRTKGLATTQLEILTAAFATCSIFTFALSFNKPKNVSTRVYIPAAKYPSSEELITLARLGPTAIWFQRNPLQIGNDIYHHISNDGQKKAVLFSKEDIASHEFVVSAAMAMVFAAVHFASWFSQFPTAGEQLGWRISCGVVLVAPVPICACMLLGNYFEIEHAQVAQGYRAGKLLRTAAFLFKGVYALARLYMIAEAGRSLYYQPKESFIATWAFIPHV